MMKVEVYSDIVCPWCYIGERRLERALDLFEGGQEVEVRFRPYQLDPNAPEQSIPLADYLRGRFGSGSEQMQRRVGGVALSEGIEIDWEAARAANTRAAHRLLGLAEREYGPAVQRSLAERLFSLHFSEGGDVADTDALATAAEAVGMDRLRALEYILSGEGAAEVTAELEHARLLGIRAVPSFIIDDRYLVEGAQSPETFVQVLEQVAAAGSAIGAESAGACDDGSCVA